ncbi:oxidoreductase [Microbacterium mangrovi]|uniref:Oxidoreductase n=1 Tax=Microbacterium mangrovi TaxID=1348253 RepID=A0A0B2A2U3_9MICO|nr:Gfo/Idh/MocA family oxidoreductase [Microbacterium mangrovi]KHK95893.1 oxidoreductase [Microbacterium mangrovi]
MGAFAPRGSGPVGVGFIGTGVISNTYLENLGSFPDVKVHILGDLNTEVAASQADKHGIAQSGTVDEVLAHPDVEIVVNLTIPKVHAEVSSNIIAAGKHVWSEKPIATTLADARALLDQADAAGLRVGIAPDTVLGPGIQTARRALLRGDIGVPIGAQTVMENVGPDIWHPSPEFLFAVGAGPLFDMGPYYLTMLANLFGPIAAVSAVGSRSRATRTIQQGPRAGTEFPVEVPTHVLAAARFDSGAVSQSVFSFDSPFARMGYVEITGTEGTMLVPDPNMFVGDVKIVGKPTVDTLMAASEPEWHTLEPVGVEAGRGLGVLDMARAIRTGVPHIATGELGYHVLDAMVAIEGAVESGESVAIESTVADIPLVPEDRDPREATLA